MLSSDYDSDDSPFFIDVEYAHARISVDRNRALEKRPTKRVFISVTHGAMFLMEEEAIELMYAIRMKLDGNKH